MRTFQFRGITFVVKSAQPGAYLGGAWKNNFTKGGEIIYRDSKHLGGPWSVAATALKNNSYHPTFRNLLKRAVDLVEQETKDVTENSDVSDAGAESVGPKPGSSGDGGTA